MRKHSRHNVDEAELDMTPMLDIVFIMLIFFIVTSTFVREDSLDITRPPQSEQNDEVKAAEVILLTLTENSEVFLFEPDSGEMRRIDSRAVRANVERLYAENNERSVVIQPHMNAETGILVRVMDQARIAGAPVAIGEVQR